MQQKSFLTIPCVAQLLSLVRIISRVQKSNSTRGTTRNRESHLGDQTESAQRNESNVSSDIGLSDLEELANFEEQMEIEQFLAEIRSSEVQSSTVSLSTHARKEFIANILISQVREFLVKVVATIQKGNAHIT